MAADRGVVRYERHLLELHLSDEESVEWIAVQNAEGAGTKRMSQPDVERREVVTPDQIRDVSLSRKWQGEPAALGFDSDLPGRRDTDEDVVGRMFDCLSSARGQRRRRRYPPEKRGSQSLELRQRFIEVGADDDGLAAGSASRPGNRIDAGEDRHRPAGPGDHNPLTVLSARHQALRIESLPLGR